MHVVTAEVESNQELEEDRPLRIGGRKVAEQARGCTSTNSSASLVLPRRHIPVSYHVQDCTKL